MLVQCTDSYSSVCLIWRAGVPPTLTPGENCTRICNSEVQEDQALAVGSASASCSHQHVQVNQGGSPASEEAAP